MTSDLIFTRGLPSNTEAERFVLGMAMLGTPLDRLEAALASDDFSLEKHRRIYSAMQAVEAQGEPVDRVTVANELIKRGQLESVDGITYLVSLDEGMPEISNIDAYVNIIRDKAVMRKLIFAAQALIEKSLGGEQAPGELLEQAERAIAVLEASARSVSFRMPMEIVTRGGGIDAFVSPVKGRGIKTPWDRLNQTLASGGFTGGQMIVVGARPGQGKTAAACQIADHAATNGVGVAMFTLEMPDESILRRMAAARAQVDAMKVTQGWASEMDRHQLLEAYADITDPEATRMWIDDSTGITVPAMRGALRRLVARHSIGLVIIDYLQLVETGSRNQRRYEQVSEISRGVKLMAREFNLPVIALAQISRETEKENRRPKLSDLRDSGSIEQDADVVIFPWMKGDNATSDILDYEFIIAKQRNGPLASIPMTFLRRYAKFIEGS